uniref:Ground-like domain-containing protein n=1 Tax=Rhabditophanes sp. KR3021 TaxID=114890 RepID=A0AC35UHP5_9BILA
MNSHRSAEDGLFGTPSPNITIRKNRDYSSSHPHLLSPRINESSVESTRGCDKSLNKLFEGLAYLETSNKMIMKCVETQKKAFAAIATWGMNSNNVAFEDVTKGMSEGYEIFFECCDQLVRAQESGIKQLKKIQEVEKTVKRAIKDLETTENEEKVIRDNLKPKMRISFPFVKTEKDLAYKNKIMYELDKNRKTKVLKERAVDISLKEMEVNKMFLFRRGMQNIAGAWRAFGVNLSTIFTCQEELVEMVPAITSENVSKFKYEGKNYTKNFIAELRDNILINLAVPNGRSNYGRRSEPVRPTQESQLIEPLNRRKSPPPPYTASAPIYKPSVLPYSPVCSEYKPSAPPRSVLRTSHSRDEYEETNTHTESDSSSNEYNGYNEFNEVQETVGPGCGGMFPGAMNPCSPRYPPQNAPCNPCRGSSYPSQYPPQYLPQYPQQYNQGNVQPGMQNYQVIAQPSMQSYHPQLISTPQNRPAQYYQMPRQEYFVRNLPTPISYQDRINYYRPYQRNIVIGESANEQPYEMKSVKSPNSVDYIQPPVLQRQILPSVTDVTRQGFIEQENNDKVYTLTSTDTEKPVRVVSTECVSQPSTVFVPNPSIPVSSYPTNTCCVNCRDEDCLFRSSIGKSIDESVDSYNKKMRGTMLETARNGTNNCSSEELKSVLSKYINKDPKSSASVIQKMADETLLSPFNVICSNTTFYYVTRSSEFCQLSMNNVHCYLFGIKP